MTTESTFSEQINANTTKAEKQQDCDKTSCISLQQSTALWHFRFYAAESLEALVRWTSTPAVRSHRGVMCIVPCHQSQKTDAVYLGSIKATPHQTLFLRAASDDGSTTTL